MVVPGRKEMEGDAEEKLEDDIVRKETWLPGNPEFMNDGVDRARSSLQEYEPYKVMAVEESLRATGDELAVSVLRNRLGRVPACMPSELCADGVGRGDRTDRSAVGLG